MEITRKTEHTERLYSSLNNIFIMFVTPSAEENIKVSANSVQTEKYSEYIYKFLIEISLKKCLNRHL